MPKRRSRFAATAFALIGAGIALALLILQVAIASYFPSVKKAVLVLNWPPLAFLEWYAGAFKNGNTDQMLGAWLLVFPVYWIVLGFTLGLGCYLLKQRWNGR